jgi:hypothetical protein
MQVNIRYSTLTPTGVTQRDGTDRWSTPAEAERFLDRVIGAWHIAPNPPVAVHRIPRLASATFRDGSVMILTVQEASSCR